MFSLFSKKKPCVPPPAGKSFYAFDLPSIANLNGGAQEYIYHNHFALPAIINKGAGTLSGAIAVTDSPMIVTRIAPTLAGMGRFTNGLIIQKASKQKKA